MVANIRTGNNFYGAASYNQVKVKKGEAAILYSQNLRGTTPKAIEKSFKNLTNSNIKKPVFHVSLSFAKEDKSKLTNEKILKITQDYLDKTGYGQQPYIVYRHNDTEHPHVHILTSRVNVQTQKKINDSHEFRKSKAITDQLETKYDLAIADSKVLLRKEISAAVNNILQTKKPENIKNLNKELSKIHSPISVKSSGKGIYFKNEDWKNTTPRGLKSSLFKEEVLDKKTLEERFANNRKDRLYVKGRVEKVLAKSPKINAVAFAEALKSEDIEVHFRQGRGDNKAVVGVAYTYKEHAYNGSTLDRDLSFNKTKDQIEFPAQQELEAASLKTSLKRNLLDNLENGKEIEMNFDGKNVDFNSSNKVLDQQLSDLPQKEAIDLSTTINRQVQGYQNTDVQGQKLIKSLAENNVEEYLQKRYSAKQKAAKKAEQRKQKR